MVSVPLLSGEQTKYFGLVSEMQSWRTLRTDHSMRCVFIWLGLATLYFGAHLFGNSDAKAIAFHRAIPWIAIVIGFSFILSDRYSFNQFRRMIRAGDAIGRKLGIEHDAFSMQDDRAGPFGITIIQWKLFTGLLAWGYITGNQYFDLHARIVQWIAQLWLLIQAAIG